jgi:hypothetical protein
VVDLKSTHVNECSRFLRLHDFALVEAAHARFVPHGYPRHVHDYFVIGLVENGAGGPLADTSERQKALSVDAGKDNNNVEVVPF